MKNYRLSRAAQEDLWQIKQYSLTAWGKQKTQKYLDNMESILENLCLSPDIGKKRDDLIIGLRSFPVQQHVIFYRYHQAELEVIRVLHSRMNTPAYFNIH
jgi:toxin ParE1/3/4